MKSVKLIPSYKNLSKVETVECGDKFVLLSQKGSGVIGVYDLLTDMKEFSCQIRIRGEVREKLKKAQIYLNKFEPYCQLVITYGFRSLEIQKKYFKEQLTKFNTSKKSKEEIFEEVHKLIAVPSVAGHPTGGAIDITIYDKKKKKYFDFGAKLYDFDDKNIATFSKKISYKARENRQLLRKVLMKYEFAPYDGEWWHFSYGDKEWAFYYKKENAIYGQKSVKEVFNK